jgi:hypothetical protein
MISNLDPEGRRGDLSRVVITWYRKKCSLKREYRCDTCFRDRDGTMASISTIDNRLAGLSAAGLSWGITTDFETATRDRTT